MPGWKQNLKLYKWWDFKVPVMMVVIYTRLACCPRAPDILGFYRSLALFLVATVGIGTLGHLINDYFDREHDQQSGAKNIFHDCDGQGILLRFISAAVVSVGPWFLLDVPGTVWLLLGCEILLFLAYSAPPLRLKERGYAGPLADSLYAFTIPLLVCWFLFGHQLQLEANYGFAAILASWGCARGLRGILGHQLLDYGRDLRSGTATIATIRGPKNVVRVLGQVMLADTLAFLVVLMALNQLVAGVLVGFFVYLVSWIIWRWKTSVQARPFVFSTLEAVHFLGYELFSGYVLRWLPLVILWQAVLGDARWCGLALLHLLAFENGPKTLLRQTVTTGREWLC